MNEKLKELKETIETKRAELENFFKKEVRGYFDHFSKILFEENPTLESFSVKAYTDYFNDGDALEYTVYSDYPDINGVPGYDIESMAYHDHAGQDPREVELVALQKKVRDFVTVFPDEMFELAFGDHSKITFHKSGTVGVEEYAHHD